MERTYPDKTEGKIAYLSIIEYIKADNLHRVTEIMRQYRFNTQAYDTIFRQAIICNRLYIAGWIYIHVTGLTEITDMLKERSSFYFRDALSHKSNDLAVWLYNTFQSNININCTPTALCCAIQHKNIAHAKWITTLPTFKKPTNADPWDIMNCLTTALRFGSTEATKLIINIIENSPEYTIDTNHDYFTDACWGGNIANIELAETLATPSYNYGFMTAIWNCHLPVLKWLYTKGKINLRENNDAAFRELFNNRVTAVHLYSASEINTKLLEIAQWFCDICPDYHIIVENNVLTGYSIDIPDIPKLEELFLDEEYISKEASSIGSIEHIEIEKDPEPAQTQNTCCVS